MLGGAPSKDAGGSAEPRQQIGHDSGGRRGGRVRYTGAPGKHPGEKPAKAVRFAARALMTSWVLVTLVLVAVPQATGLQAYAATTDAMAPAHPRGTLLLVKPVAFQELQYGDVVTFQADAERPDVDTRRIVGFDANGTGGKFLITRGDTHWAGDPVSVREPQFKGKVLYAVPLLGNLVTTGPDFWLAVAAASLIGFGVLLILRIIRNWRR